MKNSQDMAISTIINGRTIILDCFRDDFILFLYGKTVKKLHLFENLIRSGLENKELCLYASPQAASLRSAFKIYTDRYQLDLFSLGKSEDLVSLGIVLKNLCQKVASSSEYIAIRVLIDFADIGRDSETQDRILEIEAKIAERIEASFPISGVIAFDITSLHPRVAKKLIKNVQRVIISTDKETTISFNIPFSEERYRYIELLPPEITEEFVKKSLEPITLSLLREGPLSGYGLIKKIYDNFNVLLPQGTVYTLLYSLKSKGILDISTRGNSKQYFLTEAGKNYVDNKLENYSSAYNLLLALIGQRKGIS
jgi:DNA-binding PadR family transcriptional regulator